MRRSLRSWLWRVPIDQEVDEELALHAEMRRREGRPLDPGELAQVRRACLDIARQRERQMRLTQWLEERRTDVRFAVRQLRRAPGFTAVAVLTLALGIGANSAIFALADATFFRPLPFAQPAGQLVMVLERRGGDPPNAVTPLDYYDWSRQNRTLDVMAGLQSASVTIAGSDGVAEQVPAQSVTPRFFDVLGVTPLVGRAFQASDTGFVVVLGEDFWRGRLGADPSAAGRDLIIDGNAYDIVGVLPRQFQMVPPGAVRGPVQPQLWILQNEPDPGGPPFLRQSHLLSVIGRLKPGVTLDAAQADLDVVAARLEKQFPESNKGHGVVVQPLRDVLIGGEVRLTSMLLLGVVGFVLLMCCANVASLLLAQASGRTRELAVRAALGAGRGRVVTQLLTESLVLAAIGGVCALGVSAALLAAAPSLVPPTVLPPAIALSFDGRVVTVCAITALAVGLLFGLAPAWHSTRGSLVQAVATDGRVTRRGGRLRSALVAIEIAAAVLVLCGAGLLLRTLVVLQRDDGGAQAREVLTGVVNLPLPLPGRATAYPTAEAARRFYDDVAREVGAIPGVRTVAWGSALPLDGLWFGQPFMIEGDPPKPPASRDTAAYHMVSPSYFDALRIPVVAGRAFTAGDTASSPPVGVVSETFVQRFLNGRNPIGMRVTVPRIAFGLLPGGPQPPPTLEIVGVVRQVKGQVNETEPVPHIYVPLAQNAWWTASLIVAPAGGPATSLTGAVRAAMARVDKGRALSQIRTMSAIADNATARPRFRAVLTGAFAALALLLATVGVFGVLSQSVQQRMREFGVRIALGARPKDVMRLVLSHAARITAIGIVAGLALAAALGRLLTTLIYPVPPSDPVTFTLVPIVAALTALTACAAPAWRATRVDPLVTFRSE
jgi:putative ABC transport system permease protein